MRVMTILLFICAVAGAGIYAYRFYVSQTVAEQVADAATQIVSAEKAIASGDHEAARSEIATIDAQALQGTLGARYATLNARLEYADENFTEATTWLDRADQYDPAYLNAPERRVFRGQVLEFSGNTEGARAIYEDIVASSPADIRAPAEVGLGRLAEAAGALEEARDYYKRALEAAPWDSADWNEALDRLGEANVALIFSVAETSDSTYYQVESGDNLTEIGKKLNTTQGLLIRANNLADAGALNVGDRLKYTHKDFRIVIERETRRLFLYDANGIFKRYHVGLGREGKETALGRYRIGNKQQDPDWFKPGVGRIPFGDPENELGTRWMPLVPEREDLPRDLGIHGTWDDESVGEFASSGCARLTNSLVEELYDLVVRATPVEIVDRIQPGTPDGE